MSYVFNKLTNVFGLDTLLCFFKFGFDIKKMFSLLLILTVLYIVVGPTYKFMKYLFVSNNNSNHNLNHKSNHNSNHKSNYKSNHNTNQITNDKKFRPLISESSCSACYNKSSNTSSTSSTSNKSNKPKKYKKSKLTKLTKSTKSTKSVPIDKKKVAKVLRTFKIIV